MSVPEGLGVVACAVACYPRGGMLDQSQPWTTCPPPPHTHTHTPDPLPKYSSNVYMTTDTVNGVEKNVLALTAFNGDEDCPGVDCHKTVRGAFPWGAAALWRCGHRLRPLFGARARALREPSRLLAAAFGLVCVARRLQVVSNGAITTAGLFASGRYEVIAKVAPASGLVWALWTFHFEDHLPKDCSVYQCCTCVRVSGRWARVVGGGAAAKGGVGLGAQCVCAHVRGAACVRVCVSPGAFALGLCVNRRLRRNAAVQLGPRPVRLAGHRLQVPQPVQQQHWWVARALTRVCPVPACALRTGAQASARLAACEER